MGLFGGTFDPVHNAHLFIAEAARVERQLDRIVFLPAKGLHQREAPHAGAADRVAMLRGALASNPAFALDESDLSDDATGFTADLLPRLRRRYPDDAFTFIAGGDSLLESPWQRFEAVLEALDAFVIAPRADRPLAALDAFVHSLPERVRNKIAVLHLPPLAASATLVRAQLARGGSVRYVVPEFVSRYIEERRLYRSQHEAAS